MKKYNALIGLLLCLNLISIPATYADGYSTDASGQAIYGNQQTTTTTYSSQTPPPGNMPSGYTVQASTPPAPSAPVQHRHKDKDKLSISINLSDAAEQITRGEIRHVVITNDKRHHHHDDLEWVTIDRGDRLPRNIVTGGYQSNPPATLYVCRAPYRGGAHPGKLYNGACNFGWGGSEIVEPSRYEVLTSRRTLRWVPASYGAVPPRAIEGGYQHDARLYICQARYRGGMHPGKLYKESCLIGWGGEEVGIPEYYVLTK